MQLAGGCPFASAAEAAEGEDEQCQHERADLGRSFAPFGAIVMQGAIHLTPFLEGWVYIIITFML